VSHDLRAPLRAALGFAGLLAKDFAADLPAQARSLLGNAIAASQRMEQLIDDLLRFARVGQQTLTKRPVDMRALVHEVLEELRGEREGRQVEILVGELAQASADRALLKQVVSNLLANALKFTRPRERAVIEVGRRE